LAEPAPAVVRLSGSQLGGLLACPRQWFLARRVRAEGRRPPGARFGALVHTLLQHLAAGAVDRAEAVRRLDAAWDSLDFAAAWQRDSERGQALAALDRFEAWQRGHPDRTVVGLEVAFAAEVAAGPYRVRLSGQIDRLDQDSDGRCWIADYKTGKVAPTAAQAASDCQLAAYQLAVQSGALAALTGPAPRLGGAELVFVRLPARQGAAGPKVLAQPSLAAQPQLAAGAELAVERLVSEPVGPPEAYPTWAHHRLAVAAQIRAEGRYPAVAGRPCRWCQFRSSCPVAAGDEEVSL
jgi:RecB family exonuclease